MPSTRRPGLDKSTWRSLLYWRWGIVCCALTLAFLAVVVAGSPSAQAKARNDSTMLHKGASWLAPDRPAPPPPGGGYSDPTGGQCSAGSCQDLTDVLQTWTRWLSWILGGVGFIWVLAAFYRGSEPRYGHLAEGPARRIILRVLEAGLIFYIAVRIGDIAVLFENIIGGHLTDENLALQGHTPGLLGPPHGAIAELLGIITALIVQVFLMYLASRAVYQFFTTMEMILTGRIGMFFADGNRLRAIALSSMLEIIALGAGIIYIQPFLTWLFSFLVG